MLDSRLLSNTTFRLSGVPRHSFQLTAKSEEYEEANEAQGLQISRGN